MAGVQLNRVTNANLYLNGNSLLGSAEEVQLPDITALESEHKAVGMVASIMLPISLVLSRARAVDCREL